MGRSSQPHYENTLGDYDLIDIIKAYKLDFNRGNVLKYVVRAGKKDDELKDLLKAQDYLNREIEYIKMVYGKKNITTSGVLGSESSEKGT